MIFSRKRDSGRHAAPRRERDEAAGFDDRDDLDDLDEPGDVGHGPWDISEAPDGSNRIDLGSLHVPVLRGVELRVLQPGPEGQIEQLLLASGESILQLGVFAAPRTEGIWDEIRDEIRTQLFSDGVAVEEGTGQHGPELRARVRTPEGLTDLRFVGVDGPRWMVRAVYQGPAATDPEAAEPLDAVLHGLVVDRGAAAMPVREPLPLRLPPDMAEQAQAQQAEALAAEQAAQAEPVEPRKPAPAGRGGQSGTRRRPSPRPRRG